MFVPLGFTGNLLLLETFSLFPLGFKGNRFHYWKYYLSLLVSKDSFCLSLLVLQGMDHYWTFPPPPPDGFKGNRFHYWKYYYLSLLVLKDSFCLFLLVLQGIYHCWQYFLFSPLGFKGNGMQRVCPLSAVSAP